MKYKIIILSSLVLLMMFPYRSYSQNDATIYRLQALFIYNFTKHIKWDASDDRPFTIGIFSSTKHDAYIFLKKNLENKMCWGKNIKVIAINSATETAGCHLVYIPKVKDKAAPEFINQMDHSNILLVTEDDLIKQGAGISFVLINSKLKFKINKTKVEQAGLKVSSTLLAVGIPV